MDAYAFIKVKSALTALRRRLRLGRILLQRKSKRLWSQKSWRVLIILLLAIPICAMYGCDIGKKNKKVAVQGVPVLVGTVGVKDVPVYIVALGTVTAINSVTVQTQVNGQLLKVYFQEGQMIKAGDLVAEIDPRPYQAQLIQYQGLLKRDRALLANAKIDLERYKVLFAQDSISQQTLATQISLVEQYQGTVKNDIGQIDAAKLDITYCRITAPIDGKVGLIQVDPGNIVQTTSTTGIVIINSVNPINVIFSIPEDSLPQVISKIATGETLTVEAYDRSQTNLLATGDLFSVDNQINTSTGTINLKAEFNNDNNALYPNQFVNVKLLVDTLRQATVIPTSSIIYGVNGTFVYLLNSDNTVSMEPVTVVGSIGDESAITGALKSGQTIVTEGTDQLKQGTLVTILPNNNATGTVSSESV